MPFPTLRRAVCPILTLLIATTPSLFSASPVKGLLLVANKGDHTLSIVDPVAGKQLAAIPEDGITGHEVIASQDGRTAYVPIFGNSGVGKPGTDGQLIRVIDLEKKAVTGTVDFGRGVRPHCPLIHPKSGRLYVTTEIENSISVIDPKTLKVTATVPTGRPESHMMVISHDGRRAYTANVGSGTVSVLDLENNQLVKVIDVAPKVQRISISPDDRWVVTADQTALRLVVIDTATLAISHSIPLPGLAYGTAFTADGRWLLAAFPALKQVGLIDLSKKAVVKTVDVPKSPQAVLLPSGSPVAYVSCDASGQVAVIRVNDLSVEKLITVGPLADGLAWAASR